MKLITRDGIRSLVAIGRRRYAYRRNGKKQVNENRLKKVIRSCSSVLVDNSERSTQFNEPNEPAIKELPLKFEDLTFVSDQIKCPLWHTY